MSPWLRVVSRACGIGSGVLTTTLFWVAAAWLLLITFLVSADAVRRALDFSPIPGVPTLAALSVVGISFLSFPYALRRGVQVQTNVLYDRFPRGVQRGIRLLIGVLGVVLFGLLAEGAFIEALDSVGRREFVAEGSFRIPRYPVKIVIVVAAVAMVLENIRSIVHVFKNEDVTHPAEEWEAAI